MNWTPELIAAITTSLVTLLTAIGTLVVTLRTKSIVEKDVVDKDIKLDHIQEKVNGRLSEALDETKIVRDELKVLTKHIIENK